MFRACRSLSRALSDGCTLQSGASIKHRLPQCSLSPLSSSSHCNVIATPSILQAFPRFFATNQDVPSKGSKARSVEIPDNIKPKSTATQQVARNVSPKRGTTGIERARGGNRKASAGEKGLPRRDSGEKLVTGYCAAEQYNVPEVCRVLEQAGYTLDPHHTNLYPQVVHVQSTPATSESPATTAASLPGDIFIFSTGTVVAWNVDETTAMQLIYQTLLPAAENAHAQLEIETEDFEFNEDPDNAKSSITGDKIKLGTTAEQQDSHASPPHHLTDQTLVKVAFSSGLSRSVKLAVLENKLEAYVASTRSIPTQLSLGQRLPFTRSFVLQKTGELLEARAQLNLYSELTDALPDMFWDSRHDLGLEGCFEAVGRALDVGVRTRDLNRKMTYAQEIVAVLREQLHERHGYALEWLIIALISIEVGFEVLRLWKERERGVEVDVVDKASREDAALLRMYLASVMDKVLKDGDVGNPNL